MSISRTAVVVLTALFCCGLGQAGSEEYRPLRPAPPLVIKATSTDDGTGKTKESDLNWSGKILVVVFLDSERADANEICRVIRGIETYMSSKGVAFVGIARGTNEEGYRLLLRENFISWPVFFDKKNGADAILKQWKVTSTPSATIVDPKRMIAAENVPAGLLEARLSRQLKLTPPKLFDDKLVKQANLEIEVAKRLLATGNWRGAIRALSRVPADLYRSEGVMENFMPISRDLEGSIPAVIAETEKLHEEKQATKAILMLEQLKRAMTGSNQEEKIDDQLNSFLDDPDLKSEWEKTKKAMQGADLVEAGKDFESLRDFVGAYGIYVRVTKEYAGTPAAKEAKEKIAAIESDAGLKRKVRDAEYGDKAKAMFQTAESYRTSKMTDKARSFYEQIIKDYEGTSVAEEAKERLKGLK